jgi:hypothetical protein
MYSQALRAHLYNYSYLGGQDLEYSGSMPVWANYVGDPISKETGAKWTEVMVQAIDGLVCKYKVLSSNPSSIIKTK